MSEPTRTCPMCGGTNWNRNENLNYMPRANPNSEGRLDIVLQDGIPVRVFQCIGCNFLATFREAP